MTNLNYQNTIQVLIDDLDENVLHLLQSSQSTQLYFTNPVSGKTDKVIADIDGDGNIEELLYVVDVAVGKIEEQLIMEDLQDLYDFILIDDEEQADKKSAK